MPDAKRQSARKSTQTSKAETSPRKRLVRLNEEGRESVRFVQVRMETKAADYEAIELYVTINSQERVTGRLPFLGIWDADSWSNCCPFILRADSADFGSACDDPPTSIRSADCDLIWRRVVYGQRVRWRESGGTTVEYRIVSVEDAAVNDPPLSEMEKYSADDVWNGDI